MEAQFQNNMRNKMKVWSWEKLDVPMEFDALKSCY